VRWWFLSTGGLGVAVWVYNVVVFFGVIDPLG